MDKLYFSADWKTEKHVPVIEVAAVPARGEPFTIKVGVGREIAHPNTTAHHISWIDVYFVPDGAKIPIQVGRAEFSAHGASVQGADSGPVYTHPDVVFTFRTDRPGVIHSAAYCNIHGLWASEAELKIA